MRQTWKDYELAAAERHQDALAIAASRSVHTGAIYLFGYVVEMILKAAFFRAGATPVLADTWSQRRQLHKHAQARNPAWTGPANYHNLDMLADALREQRAGIGRPLPAALESGLDRRLRELRGVWSVDLRYDRRGLSPAHLRAAQKAATWVLIRYADLC